LKRWQNEGSRGWGGQVRPCRQISSIRLGLDFIGKCAKTGGEKVTRKNIIGGAKTPQRGGSLSEKIFLGNKSVTEKFGREKRAGGSGLGGNKEGQSQRERRGSSQKNHT